MSSSITPSRRVARIVFLLLVASLAVMSYAFAGILAVAGAMGAVPVWVALVMIPPMVAVASWLTAFYFEHTGAPAWRRGEPGGT